MLHHINICGTIFPLILSVNVLAAYRNFIAAPFMHILVSMLGPSKIHTLGSNQADFVHDEICMKSFP